VTPGLIRYAFLFEDLHTICTLSIWESEDAMISFSNTISHLAALRRSKRLCQSIWSAYWYLDAISKHASSWPGRKAWPPLTQHPKHPHRLVPASNEALSTKETVV